MKTDNQKPKEAAQTQVEGEAFLTKEVVAERLCVTPRTVERWARTGRLPAHRFGRRVRFKWSEVVAAVVAPQANRTNGTEATNE